MIPRDPRGCPRRSGRSRQHNGRSRFACFAKKLVQVPKKEIDEKAEEWKRSGSGTGTTSARRKSGSTPPSVGGVLAVSRSGESATVMGTLE
jgi:hypothetical protein